MKRILWLLPVLPLAVLFCTCAPSQTVTPTGDEQAEKREEAEKAYSIGAGYYAQRNYDGAMQNFERALEVDSTYYEPYIGIGNIWRFRRDPVQAEKFYRKALRLEPKRAKAYEALGDLFLEMSVIDSALVDSALAVYQQGLANDPSLVDLYNGVAEIYAKTGRTRQADSVYQVALAKFPDDISVQRLWGEFLYKQKKYEEAVQALEPLVERFANDPNVNLLREKLAAALAELGRYNEALAVLDKVLEIDPTSKQALLTQGAILSRQGKHNSAIEKFRAVLELDSTYAAAYVYIGEAMVKQGKYGSAETEFRKGLKYDSGLAGAYAGLGDINRLRGADSRGRDITATSTAKLNEARAYYEASKSYYQQAAGDPAYADYAYRMIQHANDNISLIDKELFIR